MYTTLSEDIQSLKKLVLEKKNSEEQLYKVMLLQGDMGSGKSVFCEDLITHLWRIYQDGDPIPLFISLLTCFFIHITGIFMLFYALNSIR